jgi:hypothetical protein
MCSDTAHEFQADFVGAIKSWHIKKVRVLHETVAIQTVNVAVLSVLLVKLLLLATLLFAKLEIDSIPVAVSVKEVISLFSHSSTARSHSIEKVVA